jgi:hypothetical protein
MHSAPYLSLTKDIWCHEQPLAASILEKEQRIAQIVWRIQRLHSKQEQE